MGKPRAPWPPPAAAPQPAPLLFTHRGLGPSRQGERGRARNGGKQQRGLTPGAGNFQAGSAGNSAHTEREREREKKHTHTKKALQTSTRGNEKGNFEISHPCKKPRGRLQHFVITTARLAVGSTTIPSGLAPAQSLYQ